MVIKQIEITGNRFTGPRPGNYHSADFDRPTERVAFCLLQPLEFPYYELDGINLSVIANTAGDITGPGFYGIKSYTETDETPL